MARCRCIIRRHLGDISQAAARDDAQTLAAERFPAAQYIECAQYGSAARCETRMASTYLGAASVRHRAICAWSADLGEYLGEYLRSCMLRTRYVTQRLHADVSLAEFMQGLYKAIVSAN